MLVSYPVDISFEQHHELRRHAYEADMCLADVIRNRVVYLMVSKFPDDVRVNTLEVPSYPMFITFPDGLQDWLQSYASNVPCSIPDLVKVAIAGTQESEPTEHP